ncbi:DUF6361 family protein [Olsenella intestinalis]|uniref:DUF6361 family protein n=1 Tax=Olsenella intestinalis TaxID=2930083 RepID=UPI003D161309
MLGVQVGWIDFSPEERSRTLTALRALSAPGSVDELGIGIVRDAVADVLFPGASALPANVLAVAFRQSTSIHDMLKSRLSTAASVHVCLGGQSFDTGKITQFIQCGGSRYTRVCW